MTKATTTAKTAKTAKTTAKPEKVTIIKADTKSPVAYPISAAKTAEITAEQTAILSSLIMDIAKKAHLTIKQCAFEISTRASVLQLTRHNAILQDGSEVPLISIPSKSFIDSNSLKIELVTAAILLSSNLDHTVKSKRYFTLDFKVLAESLGFACNQKPSAAFGYRIKLVQPKANALFNAIDISRLLYIYDTREPEKVEHEDKYCYRIGDEVIKTKNRLPANIEYALQQLEKRLEELDYSSLIDMYEIETELGFDEIRKIEENGKIVYRR